MPLVFKGARWCFLQHSKVIENFVMPSKGGSKMNEGIPPARGILVIGRSGQVRVQRWLVKVLSGLGEQEHKFNLRQSTYAKVADGIPSAPISLVVT
jgi:hypothetical protein